jgi:hypothetical protein
MVCMRRRGVDAPDYIAVASEIKVINTVRMAAIRRVWSFSK